MVRFGRYKYVHYEGYRPQLFDLENDPLETRDLALKSGHEAITAEGEKRLRAICDPTEVSERAFRDQERRIAELGGAKAVLNARQLSVYAGAGRGASFLLRAGRPPASCQGRGCQEVARILGWSIAGIITRSGAEAAGLVELCLAPLSHHQRLAALA